MSQRFFSMCDFFRTKTNQCRDVFDNNYYYYPLKWNSVDRIINEKLSICHWSDFDFYKVPKVKYYFIDYNNIDNWEFTPKTIEQVLYDNRNVKEPYKDLSYIFCSNGILCYRTLGGFDIAIKA
nr:hypothetical protein A5482_14135 [Cyanobacterium sp. IPPAS B-1200]